MPPVKEPCPGISGRNVMVRPCIVCGGPRDVLTAYTTNQGKRSVRKQPCCRACSNQKRKALHDRDRPRSREVHRNWAAANQEHLREHRKQKQKDPAHRALKAKHQRLRKARMRSGEGDTPEIRAIYAKAMQEEALIQRCPVFDLPELGKKLHVDHVIPLSRGGRHVIGNLQILPIGINMRKGTSCPR